MFTRRIAEQRIYAPVNYEAVAPSLRPQKM